MSWYRSVIFPLFAQMDPETVHDATMALLGGALGTPVRAILARQSSVDLPALHSTVAGLGFRNPVGLAAGFDKNASALPLFEALGFGFIEVGTVTPLPQPGNPRPRIVRFPHERALINRMGFPSVGAKLVAERLGLHRASWANRGALHRPVLGINIGKNKATNVDDAAADYVACFRTLRTQADYVVLNVSSPNTPELRKLQEPDRLRSLFSALASENPAALPVFVKIAPDLSEPELEQLLGVCLEGKISGIIATNTTLSREGLQSQTQEVGGLSGAPLFERSLRFVESICQRVGNRLPVVGVGGISSAEQALRFIGAGASLVQVYTGLVYEGPLLIKRMNLGIAAAVSRAGVRTVSEVVGAGSVEMRKLALAAGAA